MRVNWGAVAFFGLFGLLIFAGLLDAVQMWRAQRATISCHAKGMEAERYFLTTHVVCVPQPYHTVKLEEQVYGKAKEAALDSDS